jgi:hypothetical protein
MEENYGGSQGLNWAVETRRERLKYATAIQVHPGYALCTSVLCNCVSSWNVRCLRYYGHHLHSAMWSGGYLLFVEARVGARVSPCGVCGARSGSGAAFFPSSSAFVCHCHFNSATYLFIYHLGVGQRAQFRRNIVSPHRQACITH